METAYHEAGHAVVGTLLGGRVLSVTIEPDRLEYPDLAGDIEVEWDHSRYSPQRLLECEILTALAGPAAEILYQGGELRASTISAWRSDWAVALAITDGLFPTRDMQMRYLGKCCGALREKMNSDTWWWQAIAEVADLLDAHETLEGEEVAEVVQRWIVRE